MGIRCSDALHLRVKFTLDASYALCSAPSNRPQVGIRVERSVFAFQGRTTSEVIFLELWYLRHTRRVLQKLLVQLSDYLIFAQFGNTCLLSDSYGGKDAIRDWHSLIDASQSCKVHKLGLAVLI